MASSKFLHYFLFKNGDPSRNQKVPVKKADLDSTFTKKGCKRYYGSYQLYNFDGEPASKIYCSGESYYGFVKVARGEEFIGCDYQSTFEKIKKAKASARCPSAQSNCSQKSSCDKNKCSKVNKKSSNVSFKCDSAASNKCSQKKCDQPANEEVFLNPGESDEAKKLSKKWSKTMEQIKTVSQCMVIEPPCDKTKPPKKHSCKDDHIHCVTEDKFPCCNDDSSPFTSDDEEEDSKTKKKGFLCCSKNADNSSTKMPRMRRADSFCPANVKKIQTTEADFKSAQEFYKKALEVEKKRQKLYSRQKVQMSSRCAKLRDEFDKLSPKEKEKLNNEYKKAKKVYRQRRRTQEEKATKSLEKEIKTVKKK